MSECTDACWTAFRAAKEGLINELRAARLHARTLRDLADQLRQDCNDAKDDSRDAHNAWDEAADDFVAYPHSARARAALRAARNAARAALRQSTRICDQAADALAHADEASDRAQSLEDAFPDSYDQISETLRQCLLACARELAEVDPRPR